MKLQLSDWKRACLVASALLGLAAFAVFKIQHGFEEQVGWYLTLLPGSIVAAAISDLIEKVIPRAESVIFWGLLICLNFLWYYGITFTVIKAYRFVANTQHT